MADKKPVSDTVKIAAIGAVATLGAALITGAFALLQSSSSRSAPATMLLASATFTPAPLPTAAPEPTGAPEPTPTPLAQGGLAFATKVQPNGQAIDPGTTFTRTITDLYAVFSPRSMPPGVMVAADNPSENAYYAYLKPSEGSQLATFGWRWYRDGKLVNEFDADARSGTFWLQRLDNSGNGIFDGELGAGQYRVVIVLDGNPALSAELTIEP